MKPLITSVLIASTLLGQPSNSGQRGGIPGPGFGGNILNPGGGGGSTIAWPAPVNSHAGRIGATVSGRPIPGYNTGYNNGGGRGTAATSYFAYPVAYPVYVHVETAPAPQPTQIINQPAPSVIINNNYMPDTASRPVMREYSAESLPQPLGQTERKRTRPEPEETDEPGTIKSVVYLVAMKDGGVYSAVAYWLEDTTLHYITPKHDHNHASLELVDRELTDQLNRERKVPFKLSR